VTREIYFKKDSKNTMYLEEREKGFGAKYLSEE
jgi:hypothetical protein